MYDLNLSVPNFSSSKYSENDKFNLLKNYLYELNETLSFALGNIDYNNLTSTIKLQIEQDGTNNKSYYEELKKEQKEKFYILKNKIISTADEILQDCSAAIEESEKGILLTAENRFVAQSEFGEYKNEATTSIKENSDEIKLNATNIENANNNLEEYKVENSSELNLRVNSIMSQVENNFTKKSEHDEFTATVTSQISHTAQNITENFSNKFFEVSDEVTSLGGSVSELVYSLDAYIKRGELESGIYGIEIGRSDSNIKARFTNEKLSFLQGNTEVAYISGNNLYILRAEITDYLKIGNSTNGYFTLDVTGNGLEVKWSYGS